jgi:hypothetical protein
MCFLGVSFPDFQERVEAYVDDVVAVGEDESDLLIIDTICRQFEEMSGAILNRSHKMPSLALEAGLAGWPGHWTGSVHQPS